MIYQGIRIKNKLLANKKTVEREKGDDFKKLCEFRHKWDDGWVCSKCGVRKADWVESDIKTTAREESL